MILKKSLFNVILFCRRIGSHHAHNKFCQVNAVWSTKESLVKMLYNVK